MIILKNIHSLDMTDFEVISDDKYTEKLLNCANAHFPKYNEDSWFLIMFNNGMQQNISKSFGINTQLVLYWNQWRLTDTKEDIKKRQLPVVLYKKNMLFSFYSKAKEEI